MPRPSDFDLFWKDRMAEADAVELDYAIEAASVADSATCRFFDLWYTGMCGARLHAKYLKPVSEEPMPLVLQFHGYPGASRSWFEQASFAGMGMALIALDCPGQGGPSEDIGGFEARRSRAISSPVSTATRPTSTISACTRISAFCAVSFASSRASILPACM
ncbi:MAG: acetylxylan esterase [Collinsella sp.]